jgi:hypothetical protein
VRHLTALVSERRTHLTENGAVTLCGRAITGKWRRGVGADDSACAHCRERAAAIGAAPAPREDAMSPAEAAVPA